MGKFKKTETGIEGLFIIEPTVFEDSRGYFMETYNEKEFQEMGLSMKFVQDNQSSSEKGVLRGLHRQVKFPQGKLIRVLQGEVFDVGVDVRNGSSTYGHWFGASLSAENKKMLYIPEGFLHGFLVLSEIAVLSYKCTDFYAPHGECGVIWNDPDIGIGWPLEKVEAIRLSQKDQNLKRLKDCED